MFVERVLPGSVLRKLTDEEMAEYRRPFLNPARTAARRSPGRARSGRGRAGRCGEGGRGLFGLARQSDVPKLFINADPGSILVGRQREVCRAWPNQTEVT